MALGAAQHIPAGRAPRLQLKNLSLLVNHPPVRVQAELPSFSPPSQPRRRALPACLRLLAERVHSLR